MKIFSTRGYSNKKRELSFRKFRSGSTVQLSNCMDICLLSGDSNPGSLGERPKALPPMLRLQLAQNLHACFYLAGGRPDKSETRPPEIVGQGSFSFEEPVQQPIVNRPPRRPQQQGTTNNNRRPTAPPVRYLKSLLLDIFLFCFLLNLPLGSRRGTVGHLMSQ